MAKQHVKRSDLRAVNLGLAWAGFCARLRSAPASGVGSGQPLTKSDELRLYGACLGPPVVLVPFYNLLLGEGSPTKVDNRKKQGTLFLTSLLENLVVLRMAFLRLSKPARFGRDFFSCCS